MKKFILSASVLFVTLFSQLVFADTIRVGVTSWIGAGIFDIAKEKKFFADEHVNVEFVKYDEANTGKQLLSTGRIDMLDTTPETVVILTNAGVNVKVIGILDSSKGADGIVATKNIKKVSDLKGKNIAFEVGSSSHLLLSYFLQQYGLTTKDMFVHDLPASDAGAAFVAGKVDAAVTWEPWLSNASKRKGGHVLIDSKSLEIFPDLYVVNTEALKKKPKAIQAVLRAVFSAKQFADKNPEETQKILAKNFDISESDAKMQMKTLEWLSYDQNVHYSISTQGAQKVLQEAGDLWLKLGLVNHAIDANKIVDPTLLKNLYDKKKND